MKTSPQGRDIQVSFRSEASGLCVKCMISSEVRAYLPPFLGKLAAVAIVCNVWELEQPRETAQKRESSVWYWGYLLDGLWLLERAINKMFLHM